MQYFTTRKDFPEILPTEKTFFCSKCGNSPVEKIKNADDTIVYKCDCCESVNERFLAWDPRMVQYFNNNNDELVHGSVGVIVQNKQQEILLFKRVKYPFLWTIPAGHLDVGENPQSAAERELKEETGIIANELKEIFTGEIRGDSCVGGADIHFWHAYLYQVKDDVIPVIEEEEGSKWGWFSLQDVPKVTMPVQYLLSKVVVREILIIPKW